MKFTPFQLGLLAIGSFAAVVMLNLLSKYGSNEEFRDSLKSNFSPADLIDFRNRRGAEERMEPVGVSNSEDEVSEEISDEGN
jgi:hypothetical protein